MGAIKIAKATYLRKCIVRGGQVYLSYAIPGLWRRSVGGAQAAGPQLMAGSAGWPCQAETVLSATAMEAELEEHASHKASGWLLTRGSRELLYQSTKWAMFEAFTIKRGFLAMPQPSHVPFAVSYVKWILAIIPVYETKGSLQFTDQISWASAGCRERALPISIMTWQYLANLKPISL